MDDDEEITYTARGVAADPDTSYFRAIVQRSQNMTNTIHYKRCANYRTCRCSSCCYHGDKSWAAPVEPVTQTPPVASVDFHLRNLQ